MHRAGRTVVVAVTVAAPALIAPARATAEPLQLGAFLGPRIFSDDSRLGYIEDAPAHPTLDNGIALGVRLGAHLADWLVPELELALAPSGTKPVAGAAAVDVFWMQPRAHLRFEYAFDERFTPFAVAGVGAPIALSSARLTYDSDISYEGYVGAGLRFDSHAGFHVRFDARVGFTPGIINYIATEVDVSVGIEVALGKKPARAPTAPPAPVDTDRDGFVDAVDACADRPEDTDGFEDTDGCPDIDNDGDSVLDIADRCPLEAERYNGFDDDDGCTDVVPPEVDGLRGTIEGLLYAEGETAVRDSAQPNLQKIAALMAAHTSIKVVLIGHTDDREANQFAEVVEGQPAPDLAVLAEDLGRARAEAVRQALVTAGVSAPRVLIESRGTEEPVTDNGTPKARLANRRVEIKLYVPPR